MDLDMLAVHYTNLLAVVSVGLLGPLALGFFPRLRLPAIVLGIVIGPSGLGWVKPDLPVSILALVGLAFLLFLSDLTIVLVSSSLGVIAPILKDSNNISSSFGQLVIAAASIAEFGAIILLSLFFSGKGSTSTAGTLILLGIFGLVAVLVGVAIAGFEHSMSLSRVLGRLQDTTAQIRVRGAFVLLIGFTALADQVGLQLGAITEATAAGLVAAGLLSVVISPALGLTLLRRQQPAHRRETIHSERPALPA